MTALVIAGLPIVISVVLGFIYCGEELIQDDQA